MLFFSTFHKDERGTPELSTILIVALIVVPLVALLIVFRDKLEDKAQQAWDRIMNK